MYSLGYYLKHPKDFVWGCITRISPIIPAKPYIKWAYYFNTGKFLNLKNPQTFNEKIQWLKLYDHNPKYPNLVDKYLVKDYVKQEIGEEHIIKTLGEWNRFDDIDFKQLPDQFVLKCTHDSGSVVICKDKKTFNIQAAKNKITNALNSNFYYRAKERVYKDIKPRVIAEEYMVDESGVELKDYKIFCFNGEPKLIWVDFDRFNGHKRNIYDLNWKLLPFEILYPSDKNHKIEKPVVLDTLLDFAKKLSKDIPQVRVDFYVINEKIYFGELTFYSEAGYGQFRPEKWGYTLGEWITLPKQ